MELYLAIAAVIYVLLALDRIERRQSEIELRLVFLSKQSGYADLRGSEPSEHVKKLASDRRRYVDALKAYREETGSDLKQAKRAVDPLRPGA